MSFSVLPNLLGRSSRQADPVQGAPVRIEGFVVVKKTEQPPRISQLPTNSMRDQNTTPPNLSPRLHFIQQADSAETDGKWFTGAKTTSAANRAFVRPGSAVRKSSPLAPQSASSSPTPS